MGDTLGDLNAMLFRQMERLNRSDMSEEELNLEMRRASSVSLIAKNIINNADLVLRAAKFNDDRMDADKGLPPMLGTGDG